MKQPTNQANRKTLRNTQKYAFYIIPFVVMLLLTSCGGNNAPSVEEAMPTTAVTQEVTTATTVPETTEAPTTEATTEATTEPTTEATPEAATEATTEATTEPTTEATTEETTEATTQSTEPTEEMVWIPTGGGRKYHRKESCSNMINPSHVPLSKAVAKGFTACKRCY